MIDAYQLEQEFLWSDWFDAELERCFPEEKAPLAADAAPSDEEKRILVFRQALEGRRGCRWTAQRLREQGLRAIYPRNPVEFVLQFCLLCNDREDAAPYDQRRFVKLARSLLRSEEARETADSTRRRSLTLGELRAYLLDNAAQESLYAPSPGARTASITLRIREEFQQIPSGTAEAERWLRDHFRQHIRDLSGACASLRFYLSKYVYFLACHQILELKRLLLTYSETSPARLLAAWRGEVMEQHLNKWSLLWGVRNDPEVERRIQRAGERDEEESGKADQADSRVLLNALLNAFILSGSPADSQEQSPLFLRDDGKPVSLSQLRDLTSLFPAQRRDDRRHQAARAALETLSIPNFYGCRLHWGKIYWMLFAILSAAGEGLRAADDPEAEADDGVCSDFIRGLLQGRYDLSRPALLMALASVKGALRDIPALEREADTLFTAGEYLSLERADHILNRVGYVDVMDEDREDAGAAFDPIYRDIFEAEPDSLVALDSLADSVDSFREARRYSPIPFEITELSAQEAHRRMLRNG